MSDKLIGFIPKDRVDDPPRGCWVTLIECVIVAGVIGLVLAMVFVWSCQEIELSYLRSASLRLDSSLSQGSLKDGSQSLSFRSAGENNE